jgi:hypothetical protein
METPDLFETPELLPVEVQDIFARSANEDFTYEVCEKILKEVEQHGYTFDYYLEAVPFNLRKIVKE